MRICENTKRQGKFGLEIEALESSVFEEERGIAKEFLPARTSAGQARKLGCAELFDQQNGLEVAELFFPELEGNVCKVLDLAFLSLFPGLTALTVHAHDFSYGIKDFAFLQQLPSLKYLNLVGNIAEAGNEGLQVKTVDFSFSSLRGNGIEFLSIGSNSLRISDFRGLPQHRKLKALSLVGVSLSGLGQLSELTSLESLRLKQLANFSRPLNGPPPQWLDGIEQLSSLEKLQTLDLESSGISDPYIQRIDFGRMKSLKDVNVDYTFVTRRLQETLPRMRRDGVAQ